MKYFISKQRYLESIHEDSDGDDDDEDELGSKVYSRRSRNRLGSQASD